MFGKSKVFQLYNASITPEMVRQAIMGFLEEGKGFERLSVAPLSLAAPKGGYILPPLLQQLYHINRSYSSFLLR